MSYGLLILPDAARQLAALPFDLYTQVRDRIRTLAVDPVPPESRRIEGRNGWRLQIGDFRVIYEVERPAARVTVLDVSRRSDV